MKSQNSEVYFICRFDLYWYGKYDYLTNKFSWSDPSLFLSDLDCVLTQFNENSFSTFAHFSEKVPIIHQQLTPFDLAYLQTHYPEYLI